MAITNPDFDLSSSSSPVSKTDFDPPSTTAVNDSDVVFTDITTGNASATKHGFLKKLSNVATEFLNGAGNFVTLAQSSITDLVTDLAGKEATANKDATGGYAGLTLFKINFKNVANTFTSFFTNSNTAARTYTFQDRNGTIIDDTNLVTGSTDNAILRADGTGGKTSQSSGVTIDDSGNITSPRDLTINTVAGNKQLFFGALPAFPTLYSGVWLAQASPSASNYLLLGSTTQSFINAPSANIQFRVGNTTFMSVGGTGIEITSTGNTTPAGSRFTIQAGSTTISHIKFISGTKKTTPVAGDLSFNSDDLFLTITTGAAEKGIVLDNGSRLTSGRIPFATTNGRLTDDSDLTFATDTLTSTKIVGSTSIKAGSVAGFISSDGSTGASGTFTTTDLKTVTVKDGIITNIV